MVFVSNVKYCEAESGERLENFAKQLIEFRKESKFNIIAKFNGVYVEVTKETTEKDIMYHYYEVNNTNVF